MSEINNQPLLLKRNSNYIKSLMDPEHNPPASIPDDINTLHALKQLTVLNNYIITPLSADPANQIANGLIILMNNTPNYVFGVLFPFDNVSKKFSVTEAVALTPSQNLSLDYNYCRFIGGVLGIQQSTQSTTNATLSGVSAAVRYEGFPSEIVTEVYTPGTAFSQLFTSLTGITNNQVDKIKNTRLSEGVKILSLPDQFNIDYIRTDDASPSAGSLIVLANNINSNDKDLVYDFLVLPTATVQSTLFNVDIPPNTQYNLNIGTSSVTGTLTGSVTVDVCDINGDVIPSTQLILDYAFGSYTAYTYKLQSNNYGFYLKVTNNVGFTGVSNGVNVQLVVQNGSMNSIIRPTTVFAYNGVNVNTLLSIAGVRNYEVIPNPQIMRNVTVHNGYYDRDELDYIKYLMSHKSDLKLKTLYEWVEYSNFLRLTPSFANIDSDDQVAHAAGIGDLLGGIKNIVKGVLNSVPIAGPLLGGVLDSLVPSAAGGMPYHIPSAAGGMPYSAGGIPMARGTDYRPYAAGGLAYRRAYAADEDFDIMPELMSFIDNDHEDVEVFHNVINSASAQLKSCLSYDPDTRMVTIHAKIPIVHRVQTNHLHKQLLPYSIKVQAMDTVFDDNGVFEDNLEDGKYISINDVVKLDITNEPVTMFPVIIDGSLTAYTMYGVFNGFRPELINDPNIYTETNDGCKVYNLHLDRKLSFNTGKDLTLVRLHAYHGPHNLVILRKTYVEGTSCLGAMYYHCQCPDNGLSRAAITGSVMAKNGKDFKLMSNIYYYAKKKYCKTVNVPIIGIDFRMKSGMIQESFTVVTEQMQRMPTINDVQNFLWINTTPVQYNPVVAYAADNIITEEVNTNATLEDLGKTGVVNPDVNVSKKVFVTDLSSLGRFRRNNVPGSKAPQNIDYRIRDKYKTGTTELLNKITDNVTKADIDAWIERNALDDEFKVLVNLDPQALKTKNVLQNLTRTNMDSTGMQTTSLAATMARAQKVADNAAYTNRIHGITPEWVIANGFRGPNQVQVRMFRAGNVPEPGVYEAEFDDILVDKSRNTQSNLRTQMRVAQMKHISRQDKVLQQYPILLSNELSFVRDRIMERVRMGDTIDAEKLSSVMKAFKQGKVDPSELPELMDPDLVTIPGKRQFSGLTMQEQEEEITRDAIVDSEDRNELQDFVTPKPKPAYKFTAPKPEPKKKAFATTNTISYNPLLAAIKRNKDAGNN